MPLKLSRHSTSKTHPVGEVQVCGIVGAFHVNGEPVSKDFIERALERIRHRGPDEQNYMLADHIGIGHNRLKIIDLQTGQQPFLNEDNTIWLVLSGEIYNAPEIRGSLQQAGHRFRSRTDAEVALHLYEDRGLKFLTSLRGMFALAIWDSRERVLVLARDRLGIQPLHYYWKKGESFVFASECKSLFCHPALESKEILRSSVFQYLLFRYVPAPHTLYQEIYKLPPGHLLTLKEGTLQIKPYWDLSEKQSRSFLTCTKGNLHKEHEKELLSKLKESVKIHLRSDVPVGILLSGGMDSAVLVALASQINPQRIQTFSIGFPDPQYDESQYASAVADRFQTEHTTDRMNPDSFFDLIPTLIRFRDAPLSEASEVPLYQIVQNASAEVKVLLTGQGADELFGGYLKYVAEPAIRILHKRFFPWGQGLLRFAQEILPGKPRLIQELMSYMNIESDLERWIAYFSSWVPDEITHWIAASDSGVIEPGTIWNELKSLLEHIPYKEPGESMMLLDLKYWLPDNLLEGGDRMHMAASVEGRHPYLDHPLVEYVWNLPYDAKVKRMKTKVILKKAVENLLPPWTLRRRKNGFTVPLGSWFRTSLKGEIQEILFSPGAFHRDLLPPGTVSTIWREHQAGIRDHRKILWSLLNLEMWHTNH